MIWEVLSPPGRFERYGHDDDKLCPGCNKPMKSDDVPVLVNGTVTSDDDREKAEAGRAHNVEVQVAHERCANQAMYDLLQVLNPALASRMDELTQLRSAIWDAYRTLGFDTDGNDEPPASSPVLADMIRHAASEHRQDYDDAIEEVRLDKRIDAYECGHTEHADRPGIGTVGRWFPGMKRDPMNVGVWERCTLEEAKGGSDSVARTAE